MNNPEPPQLHLTNKGEREREIAVIPQRPFTAAHISLLLQLPGLGFPRPFTRTDTLQLIILYDHEDISFLQLF